MTARAHARILLAIVSCWFVVPALADVSSDVPVVEHDKDKYGIVVSATRRPQDVVNIPNGAVVITGLDLRRRGARTLADGLINAVGLDTGDGSDNGMRLPNIGMWGLKEFDALLITVDGVPIGGPFNPSLSQIPIDEIDRIEIVKGPQGTLYGVSAFAGMIQVFTNTSDEARGRITIGGGSFGDGHGSGSWSRELTPGTRLRLTAAAQRSDGSQDRVGSEVDRGSLALTRKIGEGSLTVDVGGYRDNQKWGTPQPVDASLPLPGFENPDRNYAIGGARVEHQMFSVTTRAMCPFQSGPRFENTLAFTRDDQTSLRSFVTDGTVDPFPSEGVLLKPKETTLYEDARIVGSFEHRGHHDYVAGAAVTWGKTTAEGIGFDFDQLLTAYPDMPQWNTVTVGDNRAFDDRRTFLGIYAHDAWTPVTRLTLSGGARYDNTSEKLHAFGQEVGLPAEVTDDSRSDGALSGDVSMLVRLAPKSWSGLSDANLYANFKSSFKPAAPNLTEAENAKILEPERTTSTEVGLKTRACDRQLEFNLAYFNMDFRNMVVSVLATGGGPEFINAGEERFKGIEFDATIAPKALPGVTLQLGVAHHDPKFVHFTFIAGDGVTLRDVSGKFLELAPREMANATLSYHSSLGPGGFVAVRNAGKRPLTRRNTAFADAYSEVGAGVSYEHAAWRVNLVGRNLGDDRHFVSESDIGDSQFYPAPPRRFVGEVSLGF